MPLATPTPQPVLQKIGDANRWQILSIAIEAGPTGQPGVRVTYVAYRVDTDGSSVIWTDSKRSDAYEGARLDVVMTDAAVRTAQLVRHDVPASQALYAGIRDAIYAALQADGIIPASATPI